MIVSMLLHGPPQSPPVNLTYHIESGRRWLPREESQWREQMNWWMEQSEELYTPLNELPLRPLLFLSFFQNTPLTIYSVPWEITWCLCFSWEYGHIRAHTCARAHTHTHTHTPARAFRCRSGIVVLVCALFTIFPLSYKDTNLPAFA